MAGGVQVRSSAVDASDSRPMPPNTGAISAPYEKEFQPNGQSEADLVESIVHTT